MTTHDHWAPSVPAASGAVVVSGYSGLTEVARGGDSVVYRARQDSLGRDVAIKVIDVTEPTAQARFARELAITVRLGRQHPHIVSVIDTTTTADGRPCLVMEFHDLGSLHDRLREHGPLPVSEVVAAGTAVSDALAFAHSHGVLHRDVKPQNVLLLPTSYVLSDFGIARMADAGHTASLERFSYRHASPQVLDGAEPTEADDVWSLGSTLFTLLDGRAPFASDDPDDDSALAYLRRVRMNERRPLPDDLPAELRKLVEACLTPDREQRSWSASDVLAALHRVPTELRSWAPEGGPAAAAIAVEPALPTAAAGPEPAPTATPTATEHPAAATPTRTDADNAAGDPSVANKPAAPDSPGLADVPSGEPNLPTGPPPAEPSGSSSLPTDAATPAQLQSASTDGTPATPTPTGTPAPDSTPSAAAPAPAPSTSSAHVDPASFATDAVAPSALAELAAAGPGDDGHTSARPLVPEAEPEPAPATPEASRGSPWTKIAAFIGGALVVGTAAGVLSAVLGEDDDAATPAPSATAPVEVPEVTEPLPEVSGPVQASTSNPDFAPRNPAILDNGSSVLLTWAAPAQEVDYLLVLEPGDDGGPARVVHQLAAGAEEHTVEGIDPDAAEVCFVVAGYVVEGGTPVAGASPEACTSRG